MNKDVKSWGSVSFGPNNNSHPPKTWDGGLDQGFVSLSVWVILPRKKKGINFWDHDYNQEQQMDCWLQNLQDPFCCLDFGSENDQGKIWKEYETYMSLEILGICKLFKKILEMIFQKTVDIFALFIF